MVSFSDCQGELRRLNHVVDIVDFLFLLLSLNWIDFSFLYVKDTLVHIECQAVFRPWMPNFFTWSMENETPEPCRPFWIKLLKLILKSKVLLMFKKATQCRLLKPLVLCTWCTTGFTDSSICSLSSKPFKRPTLVNKYFYCISL